MSKSFCVPQTIDIAFLDGETPYLDTQAKVYNTLHECQAETVLSANDEYAIHAFLIGDKGEEPFIPGTQEINMKAVSDIALQVINLRNQENRLFTMPVQNGEIDWNSLRHAVNSYIDTPTVYGNFTFDGNVQMEIISHGKSFIQPMINAALSFIPITERDAFAAHAQRIYNESSATNELHRIGNALRGAAAAIHLDKPLYPDVVEMKMRENETSGQAALWHLSSLPDAVAAQLREQFFGERTKLTYQGISLNASSTLAMITAVEKELHSCLRKLDAYSRESEPSMHTVTKMENLRRLVIDLQSSSGVLHYQANKENININDIRNASRAGIDASMQSCYPSQEQYLWNACSRFAELLEQKSSNASAYTPAFLQCRTLLFEAAKEYSNVTPNEALQMALQKNVGTLGYILHQEGIRVSGMPTIAEIKDAVKADCNRETNVCSQYVVQYLGDLTAGEASAFIHNYHEELVTLNAQYGFASAAPTLAVAYAIQDVMHDMSQEDIATSNLGDTLHTIMEDVEAAGLSSYVDSLDENGNLDEIGDE